VIWVQRIPLGLTHAYHHSGIVYEVDANGRITQLADFGPGSAEESISLLEAVAGFFRRPRLLTTPEEVDRHFPPGEVTIECHGPESEAEQEEVRSRIQHSLETTRLYLVQETNCQEYATEMRFGLNQGYSAEAAFAQRAIQTGLQGGYEMSSGFASRTGARMLSYRPFGNSFLGAIGNGLTFVGIVIIVGIICVLLFLVWFALTAGGTFFNERDAYKRHRSQVDEQKQRERRQQSQPTAVANSAAPTHVASQPVMVSSPVSGTRSRIQTDRKGEAHDSSRK